MWTCLGSHVLPCHALCGASASSSWLLQTV
jgi:hypothetical protein